MPIISPSIGRKVWYYPVNDPAVTRWSNGPDGEMLPCDATVIYPWGDNCVNLRVTDHAGTQHIRTSVYLVQPDTPVPAHSHCTWMPFQVGQAKKESGATAGDINPAPPPTTPYQVAGLPGANVHGIGPDVGS